nr:galactose-1-phosphate uridylyltransferase [Adlercreutzia sp. JBNU-10]
MERAARGRGPAGRAADAPDASASRVVPASAAGPAESAAGAPASAGGRVADDAAIPPPARVRARFAALEAAEGAEAAVRWLYEAERACGYIREEAVARNVCWESAAPCGMLELTINRAKPEKDPRAIAAAYEAERAAAPGPAPAAREPRCDLCWENEGWPGSSAHPAKPGLRIVPVELGGEPWGLQFSPYAYFPEHCIVLAAEHRTMRVDAAAVARLLDFADRFPFYFVGSNAGLPVVGGSILCHDHYQGGRHVFPLMKAPVEQELALDGLPGVRAGVVRWPASVLRLAASDRAPLLAAAARVMAAWERFDDEAAGILARTDAPHNAVSPILRRLAPSAGWAGAGFPAEPGASGAADAAADAVDAPIYVLDLVLRNNRATPGRPFGLFHPDESLFHIKKENIGLIEVMGRAILPGRLARELPVVQRALWDAAAAGEAPDALRARLAADPLAAPHAPWAADVLARRRADLRAEAVAPGASASTGVAASAPAEAAASDAPAADLLAPVLRDEVAQVFHQVLQATAVFKPDAAGRAARARLLAALGARPARP